MSALVVTSWNGRIHTAIHHGAKTNPANQLAEELFRIELNEREATMDIRLLRVRYRGFIAQAELRAAA